MYRARSVPSSGGVHRHAALLRRTRLILYREHDNNVQKQRRQGLSRACKMSKGPGKLYRIRSDLREKAASRRRWRPPVAKRCQSPLVFPPTSGPPRTLWKTAKGCARTTREGTLPSPPWPSVPITDADRRATVQEPLDSEAVLADTTCGIRRNPLSERDSEVTTWRQGGQKRFTLMVSS